MKEHLNKMLDSLSRLSRHFSRLAESGQWSSDACLFELDNLRGLVEYSKVIERPLQRRVEYWIGKGNFEKATKDLEGSLNIKRELAEQVVANMVQRRKGDNENPRQSARNQS